MQGRFDSQLQLSSSKGAKYGKSLNATHHFFNVRQSGATAAGGNRKLKDHHKNLLLMNASSEVSNSVNLAAMSRVSTEDKKLH